MWHIVILLGLIFDETIDEIIVAWLNIHLKNQFFKLHFQGSTWLLDDGWVLAAIDFKC